MGKKSFVNTEFIAVMDKLAAQHDIEVNNQKARSSYQQQSNTSNTPAGNKSLAYPRTEEELWRQGYGCD